MAAPLAKCRRTSPISAARRTRVCRYQKTRGHEFHPLQLSPIRLAQRQALHLLLGRLASLVGNPGPRAIQEFRVSRLLRPGFLGPRSRSSQRRTRCIALPVALAYLSDYLLFRLPSPAISPSHRARAWHPDRVHSHPGGTAPVLAAKECLTIFIPHRLNRIAE